MTDSSQTQGLSKDKSTKDEESSEAQSKPAENFSIEESFDDTRSTLQPVANKSEIADIGIRLMATELAVNNLTELMSELTRGYQNINENVAPFISGHQVSDLKDQLDDLQRDLQDKELISIRPGSINNSIKTSVNASRRPSLSSSVNLLPVPTASQSKGSINMERFTLKINSRECAAEFNKIKQEIEVIKGIIGVNDDGNLEEKTKELNLATSGSSKNYKPLTFNARMSDMEKNIKILEKCQESEKPSKASTLVDAESVSNQSSREDHGKLIGKNSEEIAFLTNQKDTAFYQIAEILHKLDKLKADKVNTDDFEEMLSEKADFKSIQKKVSIEHFNSITLDLNKKVDDFLGHMTEKETIWENSQQDLIKMIDIRLNQTDATFKVGLFLGYLCKNKYQTACLYVLGSSESKDKCSP